MEPFEYVVVLTSLILGLAIAQLLNGMADLLANWKNTKFSTSHILFVIIVFLVTIQDWYYTYLYSVDIKEWSILIVLSVLAFPIVLFLLARFLFPTGARSGETDMVVYFSENWRWLYSLFATTIVISILQNRYISGIAFFPDQIQFFVYLAFYLFFIVANVQDVLVRRVFMYAQLILWIAFVIFDTTKWVMP